MLLTKSFKARLIEHPMIEGKEYGNFTAGKKYRIYSVFTTADYTDFLVADNDGIFRWISTAVFRA